MRCPNCQGRCIGRVGSDQYYCWDCCVEFSLVRGVLRVFRLDVDGELVVSAVHPAPDVTFTQASVMQRR